MNNNDRQTMLSMISAMQSQLDAMRNIVTIAEIASKPKDEGCPHNDMTTVQTMSGVQGAFCNDCGGEFVMGVLDKDENNN